MAEVPRWTEISQQDYSWWVLHYILWLCQFYPSAWIVRKKYVELVRHANLYIHNSENHMFLELSLFSCILTLVYQLIVKSMRAFVYRCLLLLWSVKPFYSGMTRRNKLQNLIHIQDWVKAVVIRRSKCQSSFWSVLPWSITIFISGISWELHTILWTLDAVILLAIITHSSILCCYNRNVDKWIVMCETNTPSNLVAW